MNRFCPLFIFNSFVNISLQYPISWCLSVHVAPWSTAKCLLEFSQTIYWKICEKLFSSDLNFVGLMRKSVKISSKVNSLVYLVQSRNILYWGVFYILVYCLDECTHPIWTPHQVYYVLYSRTTVLSTGEYNNQNYRAKLQNSAFQFYTIKWVA